MKRSHISKIFYVFAAICFTLSLSLAKIANTCGVPPEGCDLKISIEDECVDHRADLIKYNVCVASDAKAKAYVNAFFPEETSFYSATGAYYCKKGHKFSWTIEQDDPDWVIKDDNSAEICFELVVRIDDMSDPTQVLEASAAVLDASWGCYNPCYIETTVGKWQERCGGVSDCGECEGRITQLTFRYDGDSEEIRVKDKKGHNIACFVVPKDKEEKTFTLKGTGKNNKLPSDIYIYVCDKSNNDCKNSDPDDDCELNAVFHTGCSRAIGVGLTSGDFEIIDGYSNEGGKLCQIERGKCEGKVTELTLKFMDGDDASIEVIGKNGEVLFSGDVTKEDPEFTFDGIGKEKNNTLGTEIFVYVGDSLNTSIHTSCSQPICVGMQSGSFEVVDGSSRGGGPLCECANSVKGDLSCK